MKKEFKGLWKIFSFTFRRHTTTKGYLTALIGGGIACLLLPMLIMAAVEYFGGTQEYRSSSVAKVNYVDLSGQETDYGQLNTLENENFASLTYTPFDDLDSAAAAAKGSADTLLLVMEYHDGVYEAHVLLPEDSGLKKKDANAYKDFLSENFRLLLVQKSGLSSGQLAELSVPVTSQVLDVKASEEKADGLEGIRSVFAMLIPYAVIMVLYFAILFYGQGVANSVVMEKGSKLVDTFLVTVKPPAMMLGKLLAVCFSGIIQLTTWYAGLFAGFAGGAWLVKWINPDTAMPVVLLLDTFGAVSGMFTLLGTVAAVLIVAAGLLLYCSLAAVGGAVAGKQEDLSSANILFVMALVISFLITLSGGALGGELASTNWMLYVPFTAALAAPGQILLGGMQLWQAGISLILILACTVLVTWCAGKLYGLLILYKGNKLNLGQVIRMLKDSKGKK